MRPRIYQQNNTKPATQTFRMDPAETLVTKLNELLDAVQKGEIDDVKTIVDWFEQDVDRNRTLLPAVYAGARPCPTQDDLVIAACSHNQKRVLDYLLSETDILEYLTDSTQDTTQVTEKRTEAVRHALRLEDYEMVEKLYSYWSGDLYWKGHKKDKFENLGKILKDAEISAIIRDQQLLINFKSLVTLNDFQQELYNNLPQPLSHDAPAEDTARVLLTVLRTYDKYADIDRVRIPDVTDAFERQLKLYFEDKSSTYFRALVFIKYEAYFQNLYFNIAILLLEKLYILRNHLKTRFNKSNEFINENKKLHNQYITASSSYKDIECAIYHLIYRTSEDWRLYLPAHRQLTVETHHLGIYNGIIGKLKTTYDEHKLYNAPVLYFERRYFKTSLNKLRKILIKHVIAKKTHTHTQKKKETIKILLNENYLEPMMYVSDHYSLNKIVTYIEALEQTANADVIMIERVLQVIGEMLKNSPETSHISDFTKALLQTAISTDTIKHLQDIREFLSHTDKERLSIRIDIENKQADKLRNVQKELVKTKEQIVPILDFCKSVLDKSLLQNGLDLLEKRIKKLPDGARQRVDEICRLYEERGNDLVSEDGEYYTKEWKPADLPYQMLKEIPHLLQNRDEISSKKKGIENEINNKIAKLLPKYIHNMILTLERISENYNRIDNYNKLLETFSENPKKKRKKLNLTKLDHISINANILKRRRKQLDGIINQNIENNENNENIEKMIDCIKNVKDYSKSWMSIKTMVSECIKRFSIFASLKNSPDELKIENINSVLREMNKVCSEHNQSTNNTTEQKLSFQKIKKLHNTIVERTESSRNSDGRWELIKCLNNRIQKLKKTLGYPQQIHLRKYVQRYKRDPAFRFVLEMLLADIENIINNNKHNSRKSGKLLEGIVLGNVLDHGNPFLEVIGDIFDCHELPREIMSTAISFAEDEEAVKALEKLFLANVHFDTINNGTLANMNDVQKDLYSKLIKSQNWKSYAILLREKPVKKLT
ncbi:reticulocyte-binding protein PFD0110w-like [Spodoptera litura]|uniref:Reticulocyte-binding protein PFD0110w-like n=1 Tax=Spodoptera litura TaxID=69820 RepID=A0A9J7EG02_SPOLT|nr:reticulocyte-binding protein PFD0110w-like [Spodoptera litura]